MRPITRQWSRCCRGSQGLKQMGGRQQGGGELREGESRLMEAAHHQRISFTLHA